MIPSTDGARYRRNVSHVKRYVSQEENDQNKQELADNISVNVSPDSGDGGTSEPQKAAPTMPVRPQRECRAPERFNDYYMPKP